MQNIHPKVLAAGSGAGVAGSITIIVVWVLSLYNIQIPDPVAQAGTTILAALGAWVAGYITPTPAAVPQNGTPNG